MFKRGGIEVNRDLVASVRSYTRKFAKMISDYSKKYPEIPTDKVVVEYSKEFENFNKSLSFEESIYSEA